MPDTVPTLDQFMQAPAAEVAAVAPATVIHAAGGTRRRAVLEGVSPQSDDYTRRARVQMLACMAVYFRLGVQHVFTTAIRASQMAETGLYRQRLTDWVDWGLAGPEALADYARLGWRVRLLGTNQVRELQPAAEQLIAATPPRWEHTLWWMVHASPESEWEDVLAACARTGARTRADAIRAYYGEDVPLATLYMGWGKPVVAPDLVPPLLSAELQCFFAQRPGYMLDEPMLRRILYDYAYVRHTWVADKSGRYADVPAHRATWEQPLVLGLGRRIGGFWYPEETS